MTQNLADEVAAAAQAELLSHDAQGAVRGDEVDGLDALIAFHRQQQLSQEDGTAGPGSGDGQVLRRLVRQIGLPSASTLEHREAQEKSQERQSLAIGPWSLADHRQT